MLLSVWSFRISENLHRTWQRNPEVRNMKSKNKTKKGLCLKYRPGIIDKEGSHPRPSVLLWLNAADDERGHIFRNLWWKLTLVSIFKKWASDLPDPVEIVNHLKKKKKICHLILRTLNSTCKAPLCPVLSSSSVNFPSVQRSGLTGLFF